jgi:hypothetical protein
MLFCRSQLADASGDVVIRSDRPKLLGASLARVSDRGSTFALIRAMFALILKASRMNLSSRDLVDDVIPAIHVQRFSSDESRGVVRQECGG